jgi:hypothetical protein
MTATLSYLSQMTEKFFERHMRRAAEKSTPDVNCSPTLDGGCAPCPRASRARRFIASLAIRK